MNLPKGGILIFVTGKNEVNEICQKLHQEMKFISKIKAPNEEEIISGKIDP